MVTLYFGDGGVLYPVSRRMPTNDDLPRAALDALLKGPRPGSPLKSFISSGVEIRSIRVADGLAEIDLSSTVLSEDARMAIIETMTKLPGVTSVVLTIEGKAIAGPARRVPLLYYASPTGLVAVPASFTDPRSALDRYLSMSAVPEWTTLPNDVRLLAYDYEESTGVLSLKFSYTPSLRALALDKPEQMRTLLLGLIASLTEFPQVRAVRLDFGGQTRLGLGGCSDLLGAPQPKPDLLNDERLL